MSKVLLIGRGRLAKHLVHWNQQLITPNSLFFWNRDELNSDLVEKLAQVEVVWLSISDSSIASFYDQQLLPHLKNQSLVHFSGALTHPKIHACHPLMTFSDLLYDASFYNRIHFVTSPQTLFNKVLPSFTNTHSVVSDEQRSRYHAFCVMAGNFPQLLWKELFPEFSKLNIPNEAVQAYVQQSLQNFIQLGSDSLTGPIVRQDQKTIEANIAALQSLPKLQDIYKLFATHFKATKTPAHREL